jgi:hypothetical protein
LKHALLNISDGSFDAAWIDDSHNEESFYSCGDRGCEIEIRPSGSLAKLT